jgi:hypothetical protein
MQERLAQLSNFIIISFYFGWLPTVALCVTLLKRFKGVALLWVRSSAEPVNPFPASEVRSAGVALNPPR